MRHFLSRRLFLLPVLVLLLISLGPGKSSAVEPSAAGSRPDDLSSGYYSSHYAVNSRRQAEERTASSLAQTDAPGRDLISLTKRLKLGGVGIVPASVNSLPPAYTVGAIHKFNVANIAGKGYFQISATLIVQTAHANWYVKDGFNVDLAALKASSQRFETHIYPRTRSLFGFEANPGVDNDPRITVLIGPVPGVGGYFSTADAYPRQVNPYSNERDMIYLASGPRLAAGNPNNWFESTLAHEFQHMVHWNVNPNRDIWLDEGFSEMASYLNGYRAGSSDLAFTAAPDTQLNAWDDTSKMLPHYGASYLFLRYLTERYGGEPFLKQLLQQEGLGIASIDGAVKAAGNPAGFRGAFQDWTVANVLNDPSLERGRYSYAEGGRASAGRVLTQYPATRSETVHQHGADYIKLSGNLGRARISFKGNTSAGVIAARPYNGEGFWYSNRRDSGDAMLTREFDLTSVKRATLQFAAWYDIESMFDYAYILASTDGGRSWATLKGKYTTTDNPHGTSFGDGWTGRSGAASNKAPATWVEESVDLSAYAGKKVLLRWEYITDEGYNRPGFALDNMRIPELGFRDDAEADNGWRAEGFIRIGSRVPQEWFVALVERGRTNRVTQVSVDTNGIGTLNIAGVGRGKPYRDAVLVIVALAPKTTEVANYTVTVGQR